MSDTTTKSPQQKGTKQDSRHAGIKRFFKKYGSWLLFAFVITATIIVIAKNVDIEEFWKSVYSANPWYLALAVLVVAIYWMNEAWMDLELIRIRSPHKKLAFAFNVMITGAYYNMLSPSSTAGQPLMILKMVRSGMSMGDATAVVTQKYVVYQFGVTLYAILGIIFEWKSFLSWGKIAWFGTIFGLVFNIAAALLIYATMRYPEWTEKLIMKLCRVLEKIRILKNKDYQQEVVKFIQSYQTVTRETDENKRASIRVAVLQVVSLGVYYSVIFWIYKALGLSGASLFTIIMIHGILYVSYTFLPVSGGAGGAEIMFALMYGSIFGKVEMSVGLLIWRCLTFYMILLLGGIWLAYQSFHAARSFKEAS